MILALFDGFDKDAEQGASGQPLPAFLLAAGQGFDGCFSVCIVL
jgi:hypothetical protein